jgi:hypothetical protein
MAKDYDVVNLFILFLDVGESFYLNLQYIPVLTGKPGTWSYGNSTLGDGSIVSAKPPSPEPHTMAIFGFLSPSGRILRKRSEVAVALL